MWAPDGQSVLFLERDAQGADIREVEAANGAASTVFGDAGGMANPSISPDQRRLAFATQTEAGWAVRVADRESSETQDFALGSGTIMHPQWSPTSGHISFIRQVDDQWDVFLLDVNAGVVRPLTKTNDKSEFHPKWRADGSAIIVDRNSPTPDGGTCYQIVELSVDQPDTRVLLTVDGPARAGAPSYSPNSETIVFSTSNGERDGIWSMDIDTGETNLLRGKGEGRGAGGPVFSPDGTKIAFHADVDGRFQVRVMDSDGSNEVSLVSQ